MKFENDTLKEDYQTGLIEIVKGELEAENNQINVHDNFFDLGMTSVSLVQSLNKFNDKYGLEVDITTLFEFTTISEFLDAILQLDTDLDQEDEMDEEDKILLDMDVFLGGMED